MSYSYAVGNPANPLVTSVSDPAGAITTTVDLLGRVATYRDVWGKETRSTYDHVGRVVTQSGPAGRLDVAYDAAGRVSTQRLGDEGALLAGLTVAEAGYDAGGDLASVSYPGGLANGGNGSALAVARDGAGRTARLTWTGGEGAALAESEVTRSQSGKVVDERIDGTDPDPSGPNYTYDAAGGCARPASPATPSPTPTTPRGAAGPWPAPATTPTAPR